MMTTGRKNYEGSSTLIRVNLLENPDALLDSKVAARQAAAIFKRMKEPVSVGSAVRSLRGSIDGIAAVQSFYEKLVSSSPRYTIGAE